MKKRFKSAALFVIAAMFLCTTCFANNAFTKLGRGVANSLTGWAELPKNIYNASVQDNTFSGLTLGLAKGAGMTLVRTGAGFFEVVTFPFSLPEEYKPVLEPEYVF